MKTKKPKRIRACKETFVGNGNVTYTIHQRDIRALAEQMAQDFLVCGLRWNPSMLHALRRAGMTPGRERAE